MKEKRSQALCNKIIYIDKYKSRVYFIVEIKYNQESSLISSLIVFFLSIPNIACHLDYHREIHAIRLFRMCSFLNL